MTLKARLLAPSALCVSPINLYAPPSPLPFYVQLKATIQMSRSSDTKGVWHVIGCETAIQRYSDTLLFSRREIIGNPADMQVC